MRMPRWAVEVLSCPRCGGALAGLGTTAAVVRCRTCGPFPVLGGVPVLVPEPARWCATFYDAALSALAEAGSVTSEAVETLRAFADAAPGADAARFSDDWTSAEATGARTPALTRGPASDALDELLEVAAHQSPALWLQHRAPEGVVLEVGCGAGLTASRLASRRRSLLVGDTSLRAVLNTSKHSRAVGVVLDAQALPVRARSLDGLVAENVIDLLDDPEAFFTAAARALDAAGTLLVSSPAPGLQDPDEDDAALARLAQRCGFTVKDRADGLPWLRQNSSRFLEVWLVQALALSPGNPPVTRASGRARRQR
ncbi:MAG: methyltransferase domain-containing protein [Myxococcaceae bacterium]|nr:methyltransferase domain-containing protein [Myxococcaceae bacterium]